MAKICLILIMVGLLTKKFSGYLWTTNIQYDEPDYIANAIFGKYLLEYPKSINKWNSIRAIDQPHLYQYLLAGWLTIRGIDMGKDFGEAKMFSLEKWNRYIVVGHSNDRLSYFF